MKSTKKWLTVALTAVLVVVLAACGGNNNGGNNGASATPAPTANNAGTKTEAPTEEVVNLTFWTLGSNVYDKFAEYLPI